MTVTTPTLSSAQRAPLSDWLLLAVPGIIWGTSFLFIAEGLEAIGPYGVAFARILIGFVTLGLFPAARRAIPRGDRGRLALLGLAWMALPLSLFPFAEQRVTSALTGMMNGAVPLFAALVAALIARRLPGRGIGAGLAVGLSGAGLIALPSLGAGRSSAAGVLMILAALVSYGVAINLARGLQQKHGALAVIWRAQAAALVLTAPLGVPDLVAAHWSPAPLAAMLALGSLGTGVAFVVAATAAGRLGATRASATAFFIPPVALLLGVVVRGEHVAPLSVLGGAVCLAGAWVMRRARSDAPTAPAVAAAAPRPVAPERVERAAPASARGWPAAVRSLSVLVLLIVPVAALAQERAAAGPNFLFFRYASRSSSAMYSGYSAGPALVVVGLLHNPRTSYREIMAGVGRSFRASDGDGVTLVTAGAYTNSGWYGQLYLIPSVRAGAVAASGTVALAEPLEARGARGLSVSPGNVLVTLGDAFAAGIGYYASFEAGSRPAQSVGPALQRFVPHGSVTLELVKGFFAAGDEVRLTLRSSF